VSSPDPQPRISPPGFLPGAHGRSRPHDDALRRTIEADLIPRLALSHRTGLFPPQVAAEVGRVLDAEEVEDFVRVIRGLTEAGVDRYVEELLEEGTTPEAIYLDLMAPAARRLGEMWEDDSCSFMEVSLSLGRMQRVLRGLEGRFLGGSHVDPENARRILLTALPGEQHTLGLILVAEFFLREGWSVDVGAPFSDSDPVSRLGEEWYDVAGFSVACEERLDRLTREVRRARQLSRNKDLVVLVGGPPFAGRPELARRIGADGTAGDAKQAPRVAREGLR
jgi:MerR family transcriptional regulator, light-induced transcriptional regulator